MRGWGVVGVELRLESPVWGLGAWPRGRAPLVYMQGTGFHPQPQQKKAKNLDRYFVEPQKRYSSSPHSTAQHETAECYKDHGVNLVTGTGQRDKGGAMSYSWRHLGSRRWRIKESDKDGVFWSYEEA